jgi:multisubunit Na+/H+ antiporter MnhG subunit
MTQMMSLMMTVVAARKIFISWNSSRLWVTVLLLLVVNPVFSGKYHSVSRCHYNEQEMTQLRLGS